MSQFNPYVCPSPTALTATPDTACPIRFDQVIGMALFRKSGAAPFTSTTILTSSAWTTAMAAVNSDKLILTPAFSGLTFPESEITIEGENDNSTIGGLGSIAGGNVIRPKAMFRNKSAAAMKALRKLTSESSNSTSPQIAAVFINIFGQIIANSDGTAFDLSNITVSDVFSDGLKKDNMHALSFSLPYGWSDDFALFTPSFAVIPLLPK